MHVWNSIASWEGNFQPNNSVPERQITNLYEMAILIDLYQLKSTFKLNNKVNFTELLKLMS